VNHASVVSMTTIYTQVDRGSCALPSAPPLQPFITTGLPVPAPHGILRTMAIKPTNPTDDDLPAEPTYPQFAPGTRVRDHFGHEHEVLEQVGCAVFMKDGDRWHPTKVFAVR
jgi:hypothetical protein